MIFSVKELAVNIVERPIERCVGAFPAGPMVPDQTKRIHPATFHILPTLTAHELEDQDVQIPATLYILGRGLSRIELASALKSSYTRNPNP